MMICSYNNKIRRSNKGFTLVELLVVIAILGILATIGLTAFTSAQMRGRDTQRKSDLKQIASALELYYSDYNSYPSSSSNGQILGCPSTTTSTCLWGSGSFTDNKTVYFKVLPKDPTSNANYYYQAVSGSSGQKFMLFAHLENTQDPSCISGNCINPNVPSGITCGTGIVCNFAITSANTNSSGQ